MKDVLKKIANSILKFIIKFKVSVITTIVGVSPAFPTKPTLRKKVG